MLINHPVLANPDGYTASANASMVMRGETGAGQQRQKISADKPFFFRESRRTTHPAG